MLQKDLCGVESVTELALTRDAVLETLLKSFVLVQLGSNLIVACLLLSNGLAQEPIGLLYLS